MLNRRYIPLTKQELELTVFNVFLSQTPNFLGGELFCIIQPDDDPPDIRCETAQGVRIGFELKEWLHEQQMAEGRRAENLEGSILAAVGALAPNPWQSIAYLWLFPRTRVREDDRPRFRTELFDLIREIDTRWPQEQYWHSPQGCRHHDFANYPTLLKYLAQIKFYPHDFHPGWRQSTRWIRFPNLARHYNERTLLDPLLNTIDDAIVRYRRGRPAGLTEFNLMLHYSQAFEYNAPVEIQNFSFEDAMDRARAFIGDDPGGFDRILLVRAIEPYSVHALY